jgi:hypothetical protein
VLWQTADQEIIITSKLADQDLQYPVPLWYYPVKKSRPGHVYYLVNKETSGSLQLSRSKHFKLLENNEGSTVYYSMNRSGHYRIKSEQCTI